MYSTAYHHHLSGEIFQSRECCPASSAPLHSPGSGPFFLHSLSRDVLFPLSYRTLAFLVTGQRGTVTRVFCTCPQLGAGGKGELCCGHRSVSLESQPAGTLQNCHRCSLVTCPPYCFSVESLPCGAGLNLTSTQCHLGETAWHTIDASNFTSICCLSPGSVSAPYLSFTHLSLWELTQLLNYHLVVPTPTLLHSPTQNKTQYCYHSPYWSLVARPTGHS